MNREGGPSIFKNLALLLLVATLPLQAGTGQTEKSVDGWNQLSASTELSFKDNDGKNVMIQKLDVKQVSLIDLIRFLADAGDLNLYIDSSVIDTKVTYSFKNTPLSQVLEIVLSNAGLAAQYQDGTISVDGALK